MGHNEVGCEARGGALLDNWPSSRWRRIRTGAGFVRPQLLAECDAAALQDVTRGASRTVPVLVAGTAVLALPFALRHAVIHAPTLRPALEMMLTLFCFSAVWLLRARFVDSRRVRDLLLMCVTLALGLINLSINALPAALDLRSGGYLAAAGLWGQLFVAGIFAAAATVLRRHGPGATGASGAGRLRAWRRPARCRRAGWTSDEPARTQSGRSRWCGGRGRSARPRRRGRRAPGLSGLDAGPGEPAPTRPRGRGVGDRGNSVRGRRPVPPTLRSLARGEVGAGTAMRVIATALLLCAAVVLERRVRARAARAAALAERRRVARDLHDGIAQDLAFIAAHGAQIATEMGEEHPLVVAARRALAISRSTISELSDPAGATASEALDAVAHELRDRFDVAIAVHAEIDGNVPSAVREHLSRIAREAIANAARHGQARNVLVSLQRVDGGVALRVVDDGCGIAVDERGAAQEGFGLRSMRERAGALGGSMTVRAAPRGGTELEVVLP